ncbi:MAG TPA: cytochrome c-type biogenesis CcmF C-terminal domain-containing protein [Gemmatimonadales bacterium]|nr:cytochrome c-type biogenesis CcmF C-terminal domain-containing protein [Gemmatimonadales bacterium]
MTLLGQFALWAAMLVGGYAAIVGFSGRWHGRPELALTVTRAVYALWGVLLVAAASLWQGLITHDFNIEYVASYTSRNLPSYYIVSAFWAGQKGSLLFWAVVLSTFASLAQWLTPARYRALMPYVAAVTSTVVVFFVTVMLFAANPFFRLPFTPPDGNGLNPQLQNIGMVIHPPMLYLGYISITIPFAFAIAALLARRVDAGWIVAIRKWTIMSWLFLSIGITLGMWWAYVELGWGGYWAWDPVENASLLPWLTMSAFLHSVMIQEKRGMLKRWNMTLIIGSFLLSIFGTFITRSGVIASVHSFTQSNVGYFFLAFLLGTAVLSFTLLYTRWDRLEADVQLESMVSREAAFLFNNLLLVGIAFSVLWGTLFPILSEAVRGTKISVGPPFFNKVNVPLGLLLLLLTGIGPLIAWRKASTSNLRRQFTWPVASGLVVAALCLVSRMSNFYSIMALSLAGFTGGTLFQEFFRGTTARHKMYSESYPLAFARLVARNRRRYGGYIVHLGMLIYFVAFAGYAFKTEMEATLKPGDSATLKSPFGHTYTFTHVGVSQFEQLNRVVTQASVQVTKDGKSVGVINSEKRQHFSEPAPGVRQKSFEPSTEVGIRSNLQEDLYVVFAGSVDGSEEAVYRFTINPLVMWVWIGGVVLLVGGLITMWPSGTVSSGASRRAQAGYEVQLAGSGSHG